jgi:hypothetical protein
MSNKPHEFVEHFNWEDRFITDIWYDPNTCQYKSVISDLEPVTFSSVEEIRLYLRGTLEDWSNGKV